MLPSELKDNLMWLRGPNWLVKPIPEWSLTEKVNGHTNESSQELRASEMKRLEESQTMLVRELVEVIDSTRDLVVGRN